MRTFRALKRPRGIFEIIALVCTRMEFTGRLYLGAWGDAPSKGSEYSRKYAESFMKKVNPTYASTRIHELRGKSQPNSDFFQAFRNPPLHSYVPAPLRIVGTQEVIRWEIGFSDEVQPGMHLRRHRKRLVVDGERLAADYIESLGAYAEYLYANDDLWPDSPSDRFIKGFWAAWVPYSVNRRQLKKWMSLGKALHLYGRL